MHQDGIMMNYVPIGSSQTPPVGGQKNINKLSLRHLGNPSTGWIGWTLPILGSWEHGAPLSDSFAWSGFWSAQWRQRQQRQQRQHGTLLRSLAQRTKASRSKSLKGRMKWRLCGFCCQLQRIVKVYRCLQSIVNICYVELRKYPTKSRNKFKL